MNEKTARSQIIGGVIFGIGLALLEESEFEQCFGSPVHRTLANAVFNATGKRIRELPITLDKLLGVSVA